MKITQELLYHPKSPEQLFYKSNINVMFISFILLFFVCGMVKNVHGAWPGEYSIPVQKIWWLQPNDEHAAISVDYNAETGIFSSVGNVAGDSYSVDFWAYYCENDEWYEHNRISIDVINPPTFMTSDEWYNKFFTPSPSGCPKCVEAKAAKTLECGGEENVNWSLWSDETCNGPCNLPSCDEECKKKNIGPPDQCSN